MQNEVLKRILNRLSEIFPINESSLFLNTYIVEGLHLQHGFKSRNNIDITNHWFKYQIDPPMLQALKNQNYVYSNKQYSVNSTAKWIKFSYLACLKCSRGKVAKKLRLLNQIPNNITISAREYFNKEFVLY